ncbi:Peptide deformylase [Candidatus Zixiibacteriota bacterium]|nr:Peptide deformylase [candidate division Zixibacteria bacterium]
MPGREILLLGNDRLYKIAETVRREELPLIKSIVTDMHDTILAFREKYNFGRAIAAPQIGVGKRLIYMLGDPPEVFINPVLSFPDSEEMEVWDNCMSFPDLMVKVKRFKRTKIDFLNQDWNPTSMKLDGDLSELLQHECDHLDGILTITRAIDSRSFMLRSEYLKIAAQ